MKQKCNKCKEDKELDNYREKVCARGFKYLTKTCKSCEAKYARERRHNDEKIASYYREKSNEYRINNPEKVLEYSREWQKTDKAKSFKKKYYQDNKERYDELNRNNYLKNIEKKREYSRLRYHTHIKGKK